MTRAELLALVGDRDARRALVEVLREALAPVVREAAATATQTGREAASTEPDEALVALARTTIGRARRRAAEGAGRRRGGQ